MIEKIDSIDSVDLSSSPDRSCTARTKANILKAKQRLDQKRVSMRRLAAGMKISKSSIHRILQEDLDYFSYTKDKHPELTDLQKKEENEICELGFEQLQQKRYSKVTILK